MSDTTESIRPFTAASYEKYLSENKLMASRCSQCGAVSLPPRAVCANCHSSDLVWAESNGTGKLAGFTVIYIGPNFMVAEGFGRDKPYVSGIVELDEGGKVSARITGVDASKPETIQIGMAVCVEFLHVGEGEKETTHLAFKPV